MRHVTYINMHEAFILKYIIKLEFEF